MRNLLYAATAAFGMAFIDTSAADAKTGMSGSTAAQPHYEITGPNRVRKIDPSDQARRTPPKADAKALARLKPFTRRLKVCPGPIYVKVPVCGWLMYQCLQEIRRSGRPDLFWHCLLPPAPEIEAPTQVVPDGMVEPELPVRKPAGSHAVPDDEAIDPWSKLLEPEPARTGPTN